MTQPNKSLLRDEAGATAIEYGLIVTMIAIACVASFQNVQTAVSNKWNYVATTVISN